MDKEKGYAEIIVRLENGELIVCASQKTELFRRPALVGDWSRLWNVISPSKVSATQLNDFFNQWGINIQGVCNEAGISKQYLNRCRKDGVLPGEKVMEKLLPVMGKYGFKN